MEANASLLLQQTSQPALMMDNTDETCPMETVAIVETPVDDGTDKSTAFVTQSAAVSIDSQVTDTDAPGTDNTNTTPIPSKPNENFVKQSQQRRRSLSSTSRAYHSELQPSPPVSRKVRAHSARPKHSSSRSLKQTLQKHDSLFYEQQLEQQLQELERQQQHNEHVDIHKLEHEQEHEHDDSHQSQTPTIHNQYSSNDNTLLSIDTIIPQRKPASRTRSRLSTSSLSHSKPLLSPPKLLIQGDKEDNREPAAETYAQTHENDESAVDADDIIFQEKEQGMFTQPSSALADIHDHHDDDHWTSAVTSTEPALPDIAATSKYLWTQSDMYDFRRVILDMVPIDQTEVVVHAIDGLLARIQHKWEANEHQLHNRIEEQNNERNELSQLLERERRTTADAVRRASVLSSEMEKLRQQTADMQRLKLLGERHSAKLAEAEAQLQSAQQAKEAAVGRNIALLSIERKQAAKISQLVETISEYQRQLSTASEQIDKVKALELQLETVKSELTTAREATDLSAQVVQQLQSEQEAMDSKWNNTQTKYEELQRLYDDAQDRIAEKDSAIVAAQNEGKQMADELERTIMDSKTREMEYRSQISQQQGQINRLESDSKQLRSRIINMEAELERMNELNKETNSLQKSFDQLSSVKNIYPESSPTAANQKHTRDVSDDTLRTSLEELRHSQMQLHKKTTTFGERLRALRPSEKQLMDWTQLQRHFSSLQTSHRDVNAKIHAITQVMQRLRKENASKVR